MVTIQEANVVALLVQAILYAFYLISVILTFFDGTEWKPRERIKGPVLYITILFFVFSTSDLSLSLSMSIAAMRGQTTTYNRYGTVNDTIENTTILMADAVLIYRCWIVYARSWRVIFVPVFLWLSALSCSVLIICSQTIVGWESNFYRLWIVFYCSNILTNIYATAAIIYLIFKTAKHTRHQSLHNISRILFDSGFLYALTSSMNLASSVVVGPLIMRYITDAVNFSMTGITFNLILIRISLHGSHYDTDTQYSIAIPHLSSLKFKSTTTSHTSELSTRTTATSNEESYIEVSSRPNTPLLNLECGSNGIWRDFTSTSSSKDTAYSTNPIITDHSYY